MSHHSSEAEYPVEGARRSHSQTSHSSAASRGSNHSTGDKPAIPVAHARTPVACKTTAEEYAKAKAELDAMRASYNARVRSIMQDNVSDHDIDAMPSLEKLTEERVRLSEQVRHHKDEQDSLALDIEGLDGSSEVYQLGARVQRIEHFVAHAETYTKQSLPGDIQNLVEEDRRASVKEVGAYIQELQNKRSNTLKRVAAAQENSMKRSNKADATARDEDDKLDPIDAKAAEHAVQNRDESVVLAEKIKKFRSMRTKLQSDIVKEKHDTKKMEETMQISIRNAELVNSRDARLCKDINDRNAAFTTHAQLLMGQLNVEHYGMSGAPTAKQMIEYRKQYEITPDESPNERSYARGESAASLGSRQSQTASVSSRQRNVKPPLVAMKPTQSQRNRDNAARNEREEASASHRRNSDAASYQSSRRQSISKPPLVASKPTASQQSRDNAIRNEREELSVSRSRPRSYSMSSEARAPSAAGKSVTSQR